MKLRPSGSSDRRHDSLNWPYPSTIPSTTASPTSAATATAIKAIAISVPAHYLGPTIAAVAIKRGVSCRPGTIVIVLDRRVPHIGLDYVVVAVSIFLADVNIWGGATTTPSAIAAEWPRMAPSASAGISRWVASGVLWPLL